MNQNQHRISEMGNLSICYQNTQKSKLSVSIIEKKGDGGDPW